MSIIIANGLPGQRKIDGLTNSAIANSIDSVVHHLFFCMPTNSSRSIFLLGVTDQKQQIIERRDTAGKSIIVDSKKSSCCNARISLLLLVKSSDTIGNFFRKHRLSLACDRLNQTQSANLIDQSTHTTKIVCRAENEAAAR